MAYKLTDADKILAQQMAGQMGQSTTPKSSGNFLTSILPTVGGIGGGILGSFVGPGVGTAAGGALGAGAGKWLQNLLEGKKDTTEGTLGEAALGTLGGVGKAFSAVKGAGTALKAGQGLSTAGNILKYGTQASKAASAIPTITKTTGLLGKAGTATERAGEKLLASQSLMTAAQARQAGISPVKTIANINKRTGLTKLDDMATLSKSLTGGSDSTLDMLTREAVGSTTGVKLPDLKKVAENALDEYGSLLTPNQRKAALYQATKSGSTMYGGAKGSLSTLANPSKALDQANIFRENAKLLTSGFTSTPENKQLAKVYNSLASSIEDALYKSPGVSESIPSLVKAGADDMLYKAQDLKAAGDIAGAKALEKVAVDLRGVKNIKDLRSFKKDFVELGKIDKVTAQAEGARGIGDRALSGGLNLKTALASTLAPSVGAKTIQAGQAMQQGLKLPQMSNAAKIAGTQLLGRSMTGNLPQSTQTELTGYNTTGTTGAIGSSDASLSESTQDTTPIYTREAVAKDIQNDLATTGGANMDKYITLYNFLNPESTKATSSYNKPSAQQYALASAGTTGVDQLYSMLSQNPDLLTKTAIPGQNLPIIGGLISNLAGTGEYQAISQNVLDALARARTGAAMTKSEEAFYERLLPRAGDSESTIQTKLKTLQEAFSPFMTNTSTTPDYSQLLQNM